MEWFAFIIIALMLLQHLEIQRRTEDPRNWEKTLQHYRRTILGALCLSALFVFAIVIVFLIDLFMGAHIGIIERTRHFLEGDAPVSVLVIAFFVGIARLVAERALDTKDNLFSSFKEFLQSFFAPASLKRQSSIGNLSNFSSGPQRDPWFFWLCFSLIVSVLDALSAGGTSETTTRVGTATPGASETTEVVPLRWTVGRQK